MTHISRRTTSLTLLLALSTFIVTGCGGDLKTGIFGIHEDSFNEEDAPAIADAIREIPRVQSVEVEGGIDGLTMDADVSVDMKTPDPLTAAELEAMVKAFAQHQTVDTNGFTLKVDYLGDEQEADEQTVEFTDVDVYAAAQELWPCSDFPDEPCVEETGTPFPASYLEGSLNIPQDVMDGYRKS